MATVKKVSTEQKPAPRSRAYLTKRILVTAARSGVRDAVASTIRVLGYNVIAHKGRVVRKFADGRTEDIGPIKQVTRRKGFKLLD